MAKSRYIQLRKQKALKNIQRAPEEKEEEEEEQEKDEYKQKQIRRIMRRVKKETVDVKTGRLCQITAKGFSYYRHRKQKVKLVPEKLLCRYGNHRLSLLWNMQFILLSAEGKEEKKESFL